MNPDPRREPSADMRVLAKMLRDLFLALRAEGFSNREALAVVGQVIAANRPE